MLGRKERDHLPKEAHNLHIAEEEGVETHTADVAHNPNLSYVELDRKDLVKEEDNRLGHNSVGSAVVAGTHAEEEDSQRHHRSSDRKTCSQYRSLTLESPFPNPGESDE